MILVNTWFLYVAVDIELVERDSLNCAGRRRSLRESNNRDTLYTVEPYSRRRVVHEACLTRSSPCATFAIRAPCPVASLRYARSSYSSFHPRAAEDAFGFPRVRRKLREYLSLIQLSRPTWERHFYPKNVGNMRFYTYNV